MDTQTLLELFGYLGSAMVVISMLMSSIIKLRIINTIGSVISGIYAVLCGAMPLAVMNFCLIVINLWGLYKLLNAKKKDYDLVKTNAQDSMTDYFIRRNLEDIRKFFPSFDTSSLSGKVAYTVCYEGTPAGLLIGQEKDGILDVDLDYSTPAYRDCSVGTFLYHHVLGSDFQTLRYSKEITPEHQAYLIKMGFKKNETSFELTAK